MSSHRNRLAPNNSMGMGVPTAPPPPTISHRNSGGRSSRRSRSRSPAGRSSRYVQDTRDRSRERGRRQSPSPYRGSGIINSADMYRNNSIGMHSTLQNLQNHPSHSLLQQQSISLITGDPSLPVIRRILNPEEVKIPRRPGEGSQPIFEREELKDAMLRRMRSDNNDDNPATAFQPQPHPPQQRVIAIIREPANLPMDSYRMPPSMKTVSPPPYMSEAAARHSSNLRGREQLSPPPQQSRRATTGPSTMNYRERRSVSPPPSRDRERGRTMGRSSDRKQRDILFEGRERGGGGDGEREKQPDLLQERSRDVKRQQRRSTSRSKETGRVSRVPVERTDRGGARQRSRSPVRILRDRRSRSRSVTPPPMPPEIRRQMLERERDLRSKLSRPVGKFNKFGTEGDLRDSGSLRGGRGGFRGRGLGFSRPGRSRGPWEHDMYERESKEEPASTTRDAKSGKI